ncbi:MAG TPA: hypothetical protein VN154_11025 [Rhizomicrobium sp.]|nr:hypothetical protein [Rhizomicrobium sp.]
MKRISNSTKILAAVGAIGLAGLFAGTSAASARTFTSCDSDGDNCVRVHCDWNGGNCWREPLYRNRDFYYRYDYYNRGDYGGMAYDRHWVCDGDGDNCHWERY